MLTSLTIQNFAIVERSTLPFETGMSALTGETGAGKSILVDAIGLLLGERGDAAMVGAFGDEAILVAHFELGTRAKAARQWLQDSGLVDPDAPDDIVIRRRLPKTGKSRAWINDQPVTIGQLRDLGQRLIALHGQHAHLRLLDAGEQRRILDRRVPPALLANTRTTAQALQDLRAQRDRLAEQADARRDRLELLRFQLEELDQLAPSTDDLARLQDDQRRLAHAEERMAAINAALTALEDEGAEDFLLRARQHLDLAARHAPELREASARIDEMLVLLRELAADLRAQADDDRLDPATLDTIERRLDAYLRIARKHRIEPEELAERHRVLRDEAEQLARDDASFEQLDAEIVAARSRYADAARALRAARTEASHGLADEVTQAIQALGMPGGRVFIELVEHDDRVHVNGTEDVAFTVQTNPGSPKGTLERVASGGELSRIGLALQVLDRDDDGPQTLIFDEVDTGISGRVADIVGRHLRALGRNAQVLCVTHLAQVAACAHHQIEIVKTSHASTTRTEARRVEGEARIDALASLLGGAAAGDSARATARDLLAAASRDDAEGAPRVTAPSGRR